MTRNPEENLYLLAANSYPGRGIVVGLHPDGARLVQMCWTMGRSGNSRNRVYSADNGRIFTEAADPAKLKDPTLIIYTAMSEAHPFYAVSNGHQTEAVIDGLARGRSFELVMSEWNHEPDAPNFTPRITGLLDARSRVAMFSLITKNPNSDGSVREYAYVDLAPGVGHCLTTYTGDGDPLPSFVGEPFPVPIAGEAEEIGEKFWGALNPANRVSIAVKVIDPAGEGAMIAINNQYEKAASA